VKITFTTSPKNFEFANYILGAAIRQLRDSPETRESFDLTEAELEAAVKFHQSVKKGFIREAKREWKKGKAGG
jgi:hypothetical protein